MEVAGRGAAHSLPEYLCTLQPPHGSALARKLAACRSSCQRELGVDEASLYPPHVTVTGFFHATPQQVMRVCAALVRLVRERVQREGVLRTELRGTVSTGDGHVILDVSAPGVTELAAAWAAQAAPHGIRLRAKAVRHMSLGKGRSPPEQESIERLHGDVPLGACELDLVIARLASRSDVPALRSQGRGHSFTELLRLSLPSGKAHAVLDRLPIRAPAFADASTPVRKRRGETHGGEELAAAEVGCDSADVTPPKLARPMGTTFGIGEAKRLYVDGARPCRRHVARCDEPRAHDPQD